MKNARTNVTRTKCPVFYSFYGELLKLLPIFLNATEVKISKQ